VERILREIMKGVLGEIMEEGLVRVLRRVIEKALYGVE
jgi:hypothetical protein